MEMRPNLEARKRIGRDMAREEAIIADGLTFPNASKPRSFTPLNSVQRSKQRQLRGSTQRRGPADLHDSSDHALAFTSGSVVPEPLRHSSSCSRVHRLKEEVLERGSDRLEKAEGSL